MDFIVSASTPQVLCAKLIDAGVLVMGETGATAAPGVLFSYIGAQSDAAHAFVALDEEKVANAAEVFARLQADINQPGAPLRCRAGDVPPEVVEALPDWAYRKALDRLALTAAWDAAVAAAGKDAAIWWDRATKISTLEDEWKAIVAEMVWGAESERKLINRAHNIATP